MDEQRAPKKLKKKAQKASKGSMQELEAGWGYLDKWHCPSLGTRVVKKKPTWSWISRVMQSATGKTSNYKEQKEAQGECWFVFQWGWGPGDKEL